MSHNESHLEDLKQRIATALAQGDLVTARTLLGLARTPLAAPAPADGPVPAPPIADVDRLGRAEVFADLTRDELIGLVGALGLKFFSKGDRIFSERSPGESVFAIASGGVDIVHEPSGGTPSVLAHLGPGDFFGEMAIVANVPRLASVIATEPSGLFELTTGRLEALSRKHPRVREALLQHYKERLLEDLVDVTPVLQALDAAGRRALGERVQVRAVAAGVTLVREGEVGTSFSIVLRGHCGVEGLTGDGAVRHFADLYEGDVFGEISLVRNVPAAASVRTYEQSVVITISREAFDAIILTSPAARDAVSALADARLERKTQMLAEHRRSLQKHVI